MRKTLSVAVLFLAFCCPAGAGIIHNPVPEPEPASVAPGPEAQRDVKSGTLPEAATDALKQMVLALLASVLA